MIGASETLKLAVRRAGALVGVEVSGFKKSFDDNRARLLRQMSVSCLLDVGAHVGNYALTMRRQGFTGDIVSFEPSSASLPQLRRRAARDSRWTVVPAAAGAATGTGLLNISENRQSSSLLPMLARHELSAPASRYLGKQDVPLVRLDDVSVEMALAEPLALKVDAQGYELEVLKGAAAVLGRTCLVELEMSLIPLYEGGPVYDEVLEVMRGHGFRMCDLQRAHSDAQTGELLQFNSLFVSENC